MTLESTKLQLHVYLMTSSNPDGDAAELLGTLAAVIAIKVGRAAAAAVVYAVADQVATGPALPGEVGRG